MVLYKKKYRVETNRHSSHAYQEGMYFVTICTKKKMQWFGEIENGRMVLNEVGKVIDNFWRKIPEIYTYVSLDKFVVMPDHMHGIIKLNCPVETPQWGVSTSMPHKKWSPGSLGVVINQFKMSCTKQIRAAGFPDFQWQPRYHDRIIRSAKELDAIKKYITSNPDTWDKETIPWHADGASWSL